MKLHQRVGLTLLILGVGFFPNSFNGIGNVVCTLFIVVGSLLLVRETP
jgi:hypothetical protein